MTTNENGHSKRLLGCVLKNNDILAEKVTGEFIGKMISIQV